MRQGFSSEVASWTADQGLITYDGVGKDEDPLEPVPAEFSRSTWIDAVVAIVARPRHARRVGSESRGAASSAKQPIPSALVGLFVADTG